MTASVALAVLLALTFGCTGVGKLVGGADMRQRAVHVGFDFSTYRLIGGLEAAGVIGVLAGLWLPLVGLAAATGLTAHMVGAVGVHLRNGGPLEAAAPAAILGLVTIVYVAAAVMGL